MLYISWFKIASLFYECYRIVLVGRPTENKLSILFCSILFYSILFYSIGMFMSSQVKNRVKMFSVVK